MKNLIVIFLAFFAVQAYASSLPRITATELQSKSDLIVIGTVLSVSPLKEVLDEVVISVDSLLKGDTPEKKISIILQVRGGLKDWDPQLKAGQSGVFFLKRDGDYFRPAHGGSISIFEKSYITNETC